MKKGLFNIALLLITVSCILASCESGVSVISVEQVTLDKSSVELVEGDSCQLVATVLPDNATNKVVNWSSSDESVATVEDGKVKTIAPGEALITVTSEDGKKTATCQVSSLPSLERTVVGYYQVKGSSPRTEYHHFLEDGNGYVQKYEYYSGIFRRAFVWHIEDEQLIVTYAKDSYAGSHTWVYDVEITDDGLYLKDVDMKVERDLERLNSEGTTNVDYKNPPFTNYMLLDGIYYELSYAKMKCTHGTGTSANFKYLYFYGKNGTLDPFGVVFVYSTPYYEGINNDWYEGNYYIDSESGYWRYGGFYYYRGTSSSRCDGLLTIEYVGDMMFADFELDYMSGHFEGEIY